MGASRTSVNTSARRVRWHSQADVAEMFGISERSVRRMIAEGELPAYRVGKRQIRIKAEDLDALARPIPSAEG